MYKLIDILNEYKYSDDYTLGLAKQFKHMRDFKKAYPLVYRTALNRKDLMNRIWDLMEPLGNKFNKIVYIYTFPEEKDEDGNPVKYAYVGLTADKDRRAQQHKQDIEQKASPIITHMKKSGNTPAYKELSDYIDYKRAVDLECSTMREYRANGWILLNKVECGGLGGGERKQSDDDLMNIAKNYNTVRDFREQDPKAYSLAAGRKILSNITKHMSREQASYTDDELRKIAKQYDTKDEFRKKNKSAYQSAWRKGVLDDISKHMKPLRNVYTDQEILDIGVKYKGMGEFKRLEPAVYQTAQKRGLLATINQQMKDNVSPPVGNVK